KPRRVLNEGFEHGSEIERRSADDFEHIGRGSLLLQGLAQLIEKARVLDSDDSLVGKCGDKFDLLVREGFHGSALKADGPGRDAITYQWDPEHRWIFAGPLLFMAVVLGGR